MADKLTKEQIAIFLEAFSHFDKDGDGSISTKELRNVMRNIGEKPTRAGLDALMTEFDTDQDGRISFSEFLVMIANIMGEQESEKEVREAFQLLDADGNGFLTSAEVHEVISSLEFRGKAKPSEEEVDDIIRKADTDGDGRINYEEFVKLWASEFGH